MPVTGDAPGQTASAATSPGALPDINAETYPFELVQRLLDQSAFFNLHAGANANFPDVALAGATPGKTLNGLWINQTLSRFQISMEMRSGQRALRTINRIGEPIGRFDHRWMFMPDDFEALPDREPPVTPFNAGRSQRFVMLDGKCSFREGRDGFFGFGSGVTYPGAASGGAPNMTAAAVGNIMEGFGKFSGLEGTYTYCGSFSPDKGFTGSLLCRVMDPAATLSAENSLRSYERVAPLEPGVTYLIIRGEKKDRHQQTTFDFGPNGEVRGLNVSQQLRLVYLDSASYGHAGVRSAVSIGPVVGKMTAQILFNLLNPGAPGTGVAPIPFQSYNQYSFFDNEGRPIGGFAARGGEGRTFNAKLSGAPGQAALRFGGFGLVGEGTGQFEGVSGLMTDNSVVGIAPHALSTLYVFRLNDPEERFRAAFGSVTAARENRR